MKSYNLTEQKEKKTEYPSRLMFPPKEVIKQELYRLYGKEEEKLDESLRRDLDFWLSTFRREFFIRRYPEHIAKIIFDSNKLIRTLEWQISKNSKKRHLTFDITTSLMISPFSSRTIFSCLLGIQLDSSNEMISRKAVQEAIEACSMGLELLDSFYKHNPYSSSIHIFYFEVGSREKTVADSFDLSLFQQKFSQQIETRIQVLVPPLFKQRNEEEVMRNLLILRNETSSVRDIPQVIILYDNHTHREITFTILLVRVKKNTDSPVLDLLKAHKENEEYIDGHVYFLGNVSQDSIIEGNVFKIRLKNISRFQRKNASIDYNLLQKRIAECLQTGLGEIRDYNGGIFLKQYERLEELKRLFPEVKNNHPEVLENFFYSIRPIDRQATLPIALFSAFFKLFHTLFIDEKVHFLVDICDLKLIIAFKYGDEKKLSGNEEQLLGDEISYKKVVSSKWSYGNFLFTGFILSFQTIEGLKKYEKSFPARLTQTSSQSSVPKKILHINNEFIPFDFDPRIGGKSESIAINKLLFDGLTRINKKGEIILSCADSYRFCPDTKTYIFQLKKLYWSNGQPLTAGDFEYAWKKILSPDFKTDFVYLFYFILNAQKAKEGNIPLNAVGIKALSKTELEIRIAYPTPYFLELLAHPLFSPVNSDLDKKDPGWSSGKNDNFVCNGPFKLKSPRLFYEFELEPNPYYWNGKEIELDGISISNVHPQKALEMFKSGELDWLGPPFGISKPEFMEYPDKVGYLPIPKVFWCCFNVKSFPLSNKKIRQAIFHSIDRKKMLRGIQGKNEPAYSLLPKQQTLFSPIKHLDIENKEKARKFFLEGLRELGISRKDFPSVRVTFFDHEPFHQIARSFKEQVEESLGIECLLLTVDYNELFYKMETGDYQIGTMRWSSWAWDPVRILEIFKNSNEKINFMNSEDLQYQFLIRSAHNEENQQKKNRLLLQAEEILIDGCVTLPLFYGHDFFLKSSDLSIYNGKNLQMVDFSYVGFKC
ncbi:MAG: peptide ABC transporter substrate-binding protein [Chlamydiota bacterium]